MKLIALKAHSPDGSLKLKVGDVFEMSERSAKYLIATKRAKPFEEKKKGEYKRRDMRAED